jgi:protein-disulfide isomerase
MASRTKQKEAARAARLAAEQEQAENARRQRRLQIFGGAIALVVIIVVAAVIIGSSGGGALKKGKEASATVTQVNQILNGMPQSGTQLGNPNAPVTMTYWGDLQCPVCADFTQSTAFSQLLTSLVRTGKVKINYRSVETATQDLPTFQTQQAAAYAAGKQNRFWNYAELFYRQQQTENSGYVNESFLTGLANQAGVNVSQWKAARNDPSLVSQVNTDISSAQSQQVSSTPTVQFKGPKGALTVQAGIPTFQQLQQAYTNVS